MELLYGVLGCLGILSLAKICLKSKFFSVRSHHHMESLRDKHVVVTGGSSGIGLAIAFRCASEGAFVTLIARTRSKLAAARDEIASKLGRPLESIQTKAIDICDADAITKAIEESFEWKPIDVLVCNAGMGIADIMGEAKIRNLEVVTKTNLLGCVYPIHAAIPLMKQRSLLNPSSIVIMSSLAGLVPLYGLNVYSPTKYALKGLAEVLHLELIPWNIRVNLICPGFTRTTLLEEEFFTASELTQTLASKLLSYNREALESPDEVAERTISGIKKGELLVFTNQQGASLGPLTRGLIPSESIGTFLIELALLVPYRFLSLIWYLKAKRSIYTLNAKLIGALGSKRRAERKVSAYAFEG